MTGRQLGWFVIGLSLGFSVDVFFVGWPFWRKMALKGVLIGALAGILLVTP